MNTTEAYMHEYLPLFKTTIFQVPTPLLSLLTYRRLPARPNTFDIHAPKTTSRRPLVEPTISSVHLPPLLISCLSPIPLCTSLFQTFSIQHTLYIGLRIHWEWDALLSYTRLSYYSRPPLVPPLFLFHFSTSVLLLLLATQSS